MEKWKKKILTTQYRNDDDDDDADADGSEQQNNSLRKILRESNIVCAVRYSSGIAWHSVEVRMHCANVVYNSAR